MKLKGLGSLNTATKKRIHDNKEAILRAYKRAGINGLGFVPTTKEKERKTLSFEDVVAQYNRGISKEEIQAWVWYKRSLGVPMTGWEKYYLPSSGNTTEQVVAKKETIIKDNHFRDLRSVTTGTLLGKFTGKEHEYSKGVVYIIYRDEEGLKYVLKDDVSISKSGINTDEKALADLVQKGALFYLDGEVLPYPIYAYGNMYDRELQLIKDKDYIVEAFGKAVFEKHEQIIKDCKPELLTVTSPDPKMRPIITAISDFATDIQLFSITHVREEFMDVEKAEELKKVNGSVERKKNSERINLHFDGLNQYTLIEVFIKWLFTLNADQDFKKSSAIDISDYYIKGKPLRDDKLKADQKEEIKVNARNEGEELFARFLNEVITFEDQSKLDYKWNREYNGYSDVSHMRIPIGFECSAKFKSGILQITPIQREGVAFQQAVGSGINAFDVGVGKTMTAIVNSANVLYSGQAKRILLVVPKPTYQKWINEIIGFTDRKTKQFVSGVLSGTKVTVNEWSNLGTDILKKINVKVSVPVNSITIVTYEGFKKIGFSDKIMDEMLVELVNILGQSSEKTARDKELDYQKYREMVGVGVKGTAADIDTLGFDYIIIDEAHRCKNVFALVKADKNGQKRYAMTGATSETGVKAFFLCNYIQRKHGRNAMLLTATPFTNSPIEIYSMLSLVGYESMAKMNIINIDTFFDLFILPTVEWTANYKEEIVAKEVVKSFTNRNILQRLIHNHILYKTGEEAGVKRPCKINLPRVNSTEKGKMVRLKPSDQILTYLKMNAKQRSNQNKIVELAKEATSGKRPDMGLLFKAIAWSLDNALSPFLYDNDSEEDDLTYKEFVEESPKIKYALQCIATVKEWHEKKKQSCSGQVIYMNRGKRFFELIKEYLEKEVGFKTGIVYDKSKVDEVEFITSEISDAKKEMVKEAFLDGVVKVVIGTATIREGIDLQKKGTVIYNLYPEWNPTDIRQLEGRIWRQGNMFGYVRIVMPLVQDSMDVFVFQKLEEKTARINDIWFKGSRGNVLDLEALDPQEVKLALITDVDRLVKMFFDAEKEQLNKDYRKIQSAMTTIEEIKYDISNYKTYKDAIIQLINRYYNSLVSDSIFDVSKDEFRDAAQKKDAKETRKKAQELLEALQTFKESSTQEDKEILATARKIQSFKGLSIYVDGAYKIEYFKEYVSKVRKTERNILKPKGYDLNSDLASLVELYKADLAMLLARIEHYKGEPIEQCQRWGELREEIKEKKSLLAIDGKTIEERVKDFASLNYLLEYEALHVDANNGCDLPTGKPSNKPSKEPKQLPSPSSLESELELEALALEIELELLNF